MAKTNLFAKARKISPKTKVKDQKVRISVEDPAFFVKIQKLETLQDSLKSTKAKADMISDEIKDISRVKWAELYQETSKNPGSVMVESVNEDGDTAQVMFIAQDKYITINEERADELIDTYGEDIVTEDTTFSFDSKMIETYGEILSRLIEESDEIKESDKENIIKKSTKYSVSKGTINNFKDYGDVSEVMESVKPVVALKNVEVIKS